MAEIANVPPAAKLAGVEHLYSGKVRELYRFPDGRLLFVASDRISAFDWVLPTTIPDKGRILTAMTTWWFEQFADITNHWLSSDVPAEVAGRAMVTQPLEMFPVECVARGYLTGSGLADYQASGSVCGVALPAGLTNGSRLPAPIFTPATKADVGEHDENVDFEAVSGTIGEEDANELRRLTLQIYERAEGIARDRGIIVADTKFEFGRNPSSKVITLADEVLTPDSSRFWPADKWEPGRQQSSFDKQFVRDWLTSAESGWSPKSDDPPPGLPDAVVEQTRAKYVEAY
ncbi:MAG TPA: phosphoribosylaminoimidazolesuccinocarboxamide synthase, partial [Actinomycetes bacterium]|nr:phosphoribosylaminoimidazolesuccinocarboxamide synthase [Actinomycetes bacterium]